MGRLIIEAVSDESQSVDVIGDLLVYVAVSRADDGQPVTGLGKQSFRITSSIGTVIDPVITLVSESRWESPDAEPSGCYEVWIGRGGSGHWARGDFYAFGVQVRVFDGDGVAVDHGQTVVSILSLGT